MSSSTTWTNSRFRIKLSRDGKGGRGTCACRTRDATEIWLCGRCPDYLLSLTRSRWVVKVKWPSAGTKFVASSLSVCFLGHRATIQRPGLKCLQKRGMGRLGMGKACMHQNQIPRTPAQQQQGWALRRRWDTKNRKGHNVAHALQSLLSLYSLCRAVSRCRYRRRPEGRMKHWPPQSAMCLLRNSITAACESS